mmetsp:Transcript_33833/g.84313  ORF Transcript_33833/g.84313 Transcript_33833/m.84313 type:complete len:218 (-) Transcript_33833:93-746(-)
MSRSLQCSFSAKSVSKLPFMMNGPSVSRTYEQPALALSASKRAGSSIPAFFPSMKASPTPTRCSAASMFEMTLTTEAEPHPPQWITLPPIELSKSECLRITSSSPPTRTVMSPEATRCTPPVSGASSRSMPRAFASGPSRWTSCSSVVDRSIHVPFSRGKITFSATAAITATEGSEVSTVSQRAHSSSAETHDSRPSPSRRSDSKFSFGRASATRSE